MNEIIQPLRARPLRKVRRKPVEKPPMPASLEQGAAKAVERLRKLHHGPGVAVEVRHRGDAYEVTSPHRDRASWEAMVCEAVGTRSVSTARTFLVMLAELCSQNYHPPEIEGEYGTWAPDETELAMILHMVAGVKPSNELEAAQAAQMVAVHLMQMRLSARAMRNGMIVAEDAALAGKLARTFTMQIEALAKLKGKRRSSKQTIIVKQEKHVHNHQHVHLGRGEEEIGNQPHAAMEDGIVGDGENGAVPCQNAEEGPMPRASRERQTSLPHARGRQRLRSAKGSR